MSTDDRPLDQRIDEALAKFVPAIGAAESVADAYLEQRRHAERAAAEAHERTGLALRRYQSDPVTHARVQIAVRIVERTPAGRMVDNLRREGYERAAEDLRTALVTTGALVADLTAEAQPAEELLRRVEGLAVRFLYTDDPRDLAGLGRELAELLKARR